MKTGESQIPMIYKAYAYLKNIPAFDALTKTQSWLGLRYRLTLLLSRRRNCNFTSFLRMPTQFEALSGPVLDFLFKDRKKKYLKIIVLGCSNGAEAYSIASILKNRHPSIEFEIQASDIDSEVVAKAKSASYLSEEVFNNETENVGFENFIRETFDIDNGAYIIKYDIRKHINFDVTSVLDPDLKQKLGTADVVYAQHLLIHLKPSYQKRAFDNICSLLNSKAALFVAGNEYGFIQKRTRRKNLAPLEYKIEEIHNEVGKYGQGWPWVYWGVEPFLTVRENWQNRYGTIFLKCD